MEIANGQRKSNTFPRVRDREIDIKTVSELTVTDKYWDTGSLSYGKDSGVSPGERKLLVHHMAPTLIIPFRSHIESEADLCVL